MRVAPETWLLLILAALAAATAALLFLPLNHDFAVQAARGVCVALALLLVAGLIVPWRRRLARRRKSERAGTTDENA